MRVEPPPIAKYPELWWNGNRASGAAYPWRALKRGFFLLMT